MKIAFFASNWSPETLEVIAKWAELIVQKKQDAYQLLLYEPLYQALFTEARLGLNTGASIDTFAQHSDVQADALISFGGDGTFLEAVPYVLQHQVPILGINLGRLGFLTNIKMRQKEDILFALAHKNYRLQNRVMLEVFPSTLFSGRVALNEITVQKRDSSSMISIQVFVNGLFLNNYWVDGLIVSTPTGSTAYSLSCGGPIMAPGTNVMCITPMAAHNLTVRPIVLDIYSELELIIEGRIQQYMLSMDNQTLLVEPSQKIQIRKAQQTAPFIVLEGEYFFKTLRNKLLWGADKRSM